MLKELKTCVYLKMVSIFKTNGKIKRGWKRISELLLTYEKKIYIDVIGSFFQMIGCVSI